MAATTQIAASARITNPLAMWHLLSLDAPTVAVVWVCFITRGLHLSLPRTEPVAMALAVWIIYAVDRLLDARQLDQGRGGTKDGLQARHLFHHRHQRTFLIGIALAAVSLTALLPKFSLAEIRLYLIESALLLGWLVILHASRSAHRLPKELAVGVFFSAAIFIPAVALEPELRATLLPAALLFAALCSLNCLFIHAWEHPVTADAIRRPIHPATRLSAAHLHALAILTAAGGCALALFGSTLTKPLAAASVLAIGALLRLHQVRRRLSQNNLRAAADLALLTPLLLLPFVQ